MLAITIYKMSNASRWYPVAKSHQDHQGSQREQLRTLVTFQGVACVSSNQRPYLVFLPAVSQCFQIAKVANFPTSFSFYSCVTMGRNPAFTAHAFRAAINPNCMLLQEMWCLGNYLIFVSLANFMLKWIWCGSESNDDEFYLWDVEIFPD